MTSDNSQIQFDNAELKELLAKFKADPCYVQDSLSYGVIQNSFVHKAYKLFSSNYFQRRVKCSIFPGDIFAEVVGSTNYQTLGGQQWKYVIYIKYLDGSHSVGVPLESLTLV